jgi:hypothetical protein
MVCTCAQGCSFERAVTISQSFRLLSGTFARLHRGEGRGIPRPFVVVPVAPTWTSTTDQAAFAVLTYSQACVTSFLNWS